MPLVPHSCMFNAGMASHARVTSGTRADDTAFNPDSVEKRLFPSQMLSLHMLWNSNCILQGTVERCSICNPTVSASNWNAGVSRLYV